MNTKGFTDIHMHLVPDVDDGSENLDMSMKMIAMAREEGIRTIFATPHYGNSSCTMNDSKVVAHRFALLKAKAHDLFSDMRIYRGNEIYYEEGCLLKWIENGKASSLDDSKYILIEFDRDSDITLIEKALLSILDKGWWPILAHTERYMGFYRELSIIEKLVHRGVYLQINAYSLFEQHEGPVKDFAQQLAQNELAHFIGSDAHRDYRRPPSMKLGVNYLYENCRQAYVDRLVFKNAEHILQRTRL